MFFQSNAYLLFLPAIWLAHHFIGQRYRWVFLLLASLAFYAVLQVPYLLAVIAGVTVVTYLFGIRLGRAASEKSRKVLFWGGVGCNLLVLITLKYLPFITDNLNLLLDFSAPGTRIEFRMAFVAIGVSYYVFQAISYLTDIYLEIDQPEHHFGYFALYMTFFPKLLQGPIERAGDLLPQLHREYQFNYDAVRTGLVFFVWGLFKKVVLADRLGMYVDTIYSQPDAYSGLPVLLATYAYAFQIYFDFSGYTDMALGSARLFNIELTQNFNRPYLATSVADFWRRWHITFSRWILDYIFKPLQMHWRTLGAVGTSLALLVTFFVSGIWHGASWNFIVWGLLHGLYLAGSVLYRPYQAKLHKYLGLKGSRLLRYWQVFVTFNLVCLAWVFFRTPDMDAAASIFQAIFVFNGFDLGNAALLPSNGVYLLVGVLLYLGLDRLVREDCRLLQLPALSRWGFYYLLFFLVFYAGVDGSARFIYFQF